MRHLVAVVVAMALIDVASVPTLVLLEELSRRKDAKPECASKSSGPYNTALHVFALILILLLSVSCEQANL